MSHLDFHKVRISINGLSICEQFSLRLKKGMVCGILGPNGSGKSTFLHTLAALHPLQSGTILWQDQALLTLSPYQRARQLGILLQNSHFTFPQKVSDYCLSSRYPWHSAFSNQAHVAIVEQALATVDLMHKYNHSILNLSGGEKWRLRIAALLTQQPDIYLLDEPTNHLDSKYQVTVLKHFQALAQHEQKLIIMATHDINLAARFCDYLLLFFGDAKILHGTSKEMLTAANLSALYDCPINRQEVWGIS